MAEDEFVLDEDLLDDDGDGEEDDVVVVVAVGVVDVEDAVVCCWNALAAATENAPVSVTAPAASHRLTREVSASPRLREAGVSGVGSVARGSVMPCSVVTPRERPRSAAS